MPLKSLTDADIGKRFKVTSGNVGWIGTILTYHGKDPRGTYVGDSWASYTDLGGRGKHSLCYTYWPSRDHGGEYNPLECWSPYEDGVTVGPGIVRASVDGYVCVRCNTHNVYAGPEHLRTYKGKEGCYVCYECK